MINFEEIAIARLLTKEKFLIYSQLHPDLFVEFRKVYEFIIDFYAKNKTLPSQKIIAEIFNISFNDDETISDDFIISYLEDRKLYSVLGDSLKKAANLLNLGTPVRDVLAYLQDSISRGITTRVSHQGKTLDVAYQGFFSTYMNNFNGAVKIPVLWDSVNFLSNGGISRGEFLVIASRPGTTKTWSLLLSAFYAWTNNFKVLFISPEMTSFSILSRLVSLILNISFTRLRTITIEPDLLLKFNDVLQDLNLDPTNFIILADDFDRNVDAIERAIDVYKPDVVCIDGLYLLQSRMKTGPLWERTKEVVDSLSRFSKYYNVSIISTTQLNRQAITADDPAFIAYSDAIVQDADYIFSIEKIASADVIKSLKKQGFDVLEYLDKSFVNSSVSFYQIFPLKIRDDSPNYKLFVGLSFSGGISFFEYLLPQFDIELRVKYVFRNLNISDSSIFIAKGSNTDKVFVPSGKVVVIKDFYSGGLNFKNIFDYILSSSKTQFSTPQDEDLEKESPF